MTTVFMKSAGLESAGLGHGPGHDHQYRGERGQRNVACEWAAISMNTNRNTECSMPEMGPRASARTLVAVRAIRPVTQMPPNHGRVEAAVRRDARGGLDFADAPIVFAGRTITVQDTRKDYGEDRFQSGPRRAGGLSQDRQRMANAHQRRPAKGRPKAHGLITPRRDARR
jgi:uncharacterized DUF497 family protein